MSLLNVPDALPAGMTLLWRWFLVESKPQREADLIAAISPEALSSDASKEGAAGKKTHQLILEAVRLGILVRDGGEILALSPDAPRSLPWSVEGNLKFRSFVRQRIMEGTDELRIALAWLMQQNFFHVDGLTYKNVSDTGRGREGAGGLINDARWANLERWASWLGFAWSHGKGLMPDPTDALREEVLPELDRQNPGTAIPLSRVRELIGAQLPVLDGGVVFGEVQSEEEEARHDHLSASLSVALLRLHKDGALVLEKLSDSRDVIFLRTDPASFTAYTHVRTRMRGYSGAAS